MQHKKLEQEHDRTKVTKTAETERWAWEYHNDGTWRTAYGDVSVSIFVHSDYSDCHLARLRFSCLNHQYASHVRLQSTTTDSVEVLQKVEEYVLQARDKIVEEAEADDSKDSAGS